MAQRRRPTYSPNSKQRPCVFASLRGTASQIARDLGVAVGTLRIWGRRPADTQRRR